MHADRLSEVIREAEASTEGAFVRHDRRRGAVRVSGRDGLDLLNRLTTAKVDTLVAGEVRETLVTNEKGRVMDAVLIAPDDEGLLLLTSEATAPALITWLEKYTIMEDCRYTDASGDWAQFTVHQVPEAGLVGFSSLQPGQAEQGVVGDITLRALRHDSVTGAGLRLLCSGEDADALRHFLAADAGLPFLGDHAFALWRVDHLVPAVGHELSEHANPLESGAAASVDFEKGCYIGQEVIARLDSYDKVQRRPRRLSWTGEAPETLPPAAALTSDGRNAGFVTTHVFDPRSETWRGIGLIRNAYTDAGTALSCIMDETEHSVIVSE